VIVPDSPDITKDLRLALKHKPPGDDEISKCQAAVLVPLLVGDATSSGKPQLLLTRRSVHLSEHAGEVAFPGGHSHTDDPSLVDTALREAWEEVGLDKSLVEILGCLSPSRTRGMRYVLPCIALIQKKPVLSVNIGEVDEIFLVPIEFFCQENLLAHEIRYEGRTHRIPRFKYDQHDIWGFTANIISILCTQTLGWSLNLQALGSSQVERYQPQNP
jgi:8-oxo-dGTP pyrophosphatase MutT (NUDIX family)